MTYIDILIVILTVQPLVWTSKKSEDDTYRQAQIDVRVTFRPNVVYVDYSYLYIIYIIAYARLLQF
jgi:hypothetical protein